LCARKKEHWTAPPQLNLVQNSAQLYLGSDVMRPSIILKLQHAVHSRK